MRKYLASSLLLRKIATFKFGKAVEIYYCGGMEHLQNKAIWNIYNLDEIFLPITKYKKECIALVDSSSSRDGRIVGIEIDPQDIKIVIDHHRDSDLKENGHNFVLIEEVGACTTLVAEILYALNIELEEESMEATLGAIGILTDTTNFCSANRKDAKIFEKLFEKSDHIRYREIVNYEIPKEYYMYLATALQVMKSKDGRLVAGLGWIKNDEEGAIAFVTERLSRIPGTTIAIIWGITQNEGNGVVRISVRSRDITQNLNSYLKKLFGENSGGKLMPDLKGSGGTKRELISNFWIGPETKETITELVQKRIEKFIFEEDTPPAKIN